jgi:hypothetical protein
LSVSVSQEQLNPVRCRELTLELPPSGIRLGTKPPSAPGALFDEPQQ